MKKVLVVIVSLLFFVNISVVKCKDITYKLGQVVKYDNMEFYVIKDNGDSVTMLKQTLLTYDELFQYYPVEVNDSIKREKIKEDSSSNAIMPFCDYLYNLESNCNYDSSVVKYVIDEWTKNKFREGDLVSDDNGYTSRLLTIDELDSQFSFGYMYRISSLLPKWLYKYNYWIMDEYGNSNNATIISYYNNLEPVIRGMINKNDLFSVRPIVTVKKDKVEYVNPSNPTAKEYDALYKTDYKIGDIINYNNTKFYVLKNSKATDEIVTVIKAEPLNVTEVEKYGVGHINRYLFDKEGIVSNINGYGAVAYYSREYCREDSAPYNTSCTPLYNNSEIKYIVDAWGDDVINEEDLVIEKNNKYRILNKDDVITHLKYVDYKGTTTVNVEYLNKSDESPNFDLTGCWTDYVVDDSQMRVLMKGIDDNFYMQFVFYDKGTICPVVNFKKSVDINTNNTDINTDSVVVPDTSFTNTIITVVCGIIIACVSSLIYIYSKIRKKRYHK